MSIASPVSNSNYPFSSTTIQTAHFNEIHPFLIKSTRFQHQLPIFKHHHPKLLVFNQINMFLIKSTCFQHQLPISTTTAHFQSPTSVFNENRTTLLLTKILLIPDKLSMLDVVAYLRR
jgi:hypothetical protein